MPHGSNYNRVRQLVARAAGAVRVNDWRFSQIDPDGLRYLATISVRGHWFVVAIAVIELVYRPYLVFGVARYASYVLLVLVLIGFVGCIHYRILSNRPVTWRWVSALYALDVFLVSAMLALSDGFSHDFVHLFYYPAIAWMAVLFASFWLNIAWVTLVSLVYVGISLTVEDGIVNGGAKVDRVGGSLLTYRRLNTVPPAIIHRVVSDPMDGVMDVQGGRISSYMTLLTRGQRGVNSRERPCFTSGRA